MEPSLLEIWGFDFDFAKWPQQTYHPPINPVLSMDETRILDDVNNATVTSVVTGNRVDVRSLLGGVTEQGGRILKAKVGSNLILDNLT